MNRREVPIVERCSQTWNDLGGTDRRRRHCAVCDAPVVNLSAMTEGDARAFLARADERTCLAYRFDPDGHVVFAADLVPARRRTARIATAAAAVSLAMTSSCSPPSPGTRATKALVQAPDDSPAPTPPAEAEPPEADPAPADSAQAEPLECALYRQLYALGGYATTMPEECEEAEDGALTRSP